MYTFLKRLLKSSFNKSFIYSRSLAAVILLMVVVTKFFAVVGPTHQISSAASVAVILTSITRTITVTLTLVTRVLRSATSSVLY